MQYQLDRLADEFLEALDRLHALHRTVPSERWAERRDSARWSVAECIAHLNLTSVALLPLLERGLVEAKAIGGPAPARYRRDPVGWLMWRMIGPPARIRVTTSAAFVPQATMPPADLVAEFERLQEALVALLRAADGLPLSRVKVASPFSSRVRYNLFACFGVLARHQHRHLWQAEQLWRAAMLTPPSAS